jgi:HSP20 family protein
MNFRGLENDFLTAFVRPDDLAHAMRNAGQPPQHVSTRVWSPPVDVYEDQDAIVIKVDLPGMKQEDIDIEMNNDNLTIKGERKFEDEARRDKYVRVERQYGLFQRSFTIGVAIEADKVKATYRDGMLELTLPKAEAVKPKKVQVVAE